MVQLGDERRVSLGQKVGADYCGKVECEQDLKGKALQ